MLCQNCGQDNPPEASFCLKCGATLVKSFAPDVGSSYGNGWTQLWKHFLELFLIGIIYVVISLPFSIVQWVTGGHIGLSGISFFYSLLIVGPVGYGLAFAYLKAARGDKVEIHDMFASFQNYWNAVLAGLLVLVIVIIGLVLLIVPGIIFACKLAFTPYLVVDRKMGVIEAVKESWRMTGGHTWKVFLIGLLGIPIMIAGAICLGVCIIIAVMWISMALASLYHAVSTAGSVSSQIMQTSPPQPAT
jgi:uncharacterized membrane protein